jgi:hypothetical protein
MSLGVLPIFQHATVRRMNQIIRRRGAGLGTHRVSLSLMFAVDAQAGDRNRAGRGVFGRSPWDSGPLVVEVRWRGGGNEAGEILILKELRRARLIGCAGDGGGQF